MNAVTLKEFFPLIKENKVWLGISPRGMDFITQKNELESVNAVWFTNLDNHKRHKDLILHKKYNPKEYPNYDNYNAINVDKTLDIPKDYDGIMGVPITFLDKYNPKQFEIISFRKGDDGEDLIINGKYPYNRILIRKRKRGK